MIKTRWKQLAEAFLALSDVKREWQLCRLAMFNQQLSG